MREYEFVVIEIMVYNGMSPCSTSLLWVYCGRRWTFWTCTGLRKFKGTEHNTNRISVSFRYWEITFQKVYTSIWDNLYNLCTGEEERLFMYQKSFSFNRLTARDADKESSTLILYATSFHLRLLVRRCVLNQLVPIRRRSTSCVWQQSTFEL